MARDKGDWKASRLKAEQLLSFLNGSSTALLEIARADLKLGQNAEAATEVQHVIDMGQANDVLLKAPFDAIPGVAEKVRSNLSPVSNGTLVSEVPDEGLLAEDIDYDPGSQRFFVSGVLAKKIVTLDRAGKAKDFATAPDGWSMMAVKVDPKRSRLWATEVALEGFSIVPKADWGRSFLLCYDLSSAKLLAKIEGPAHSALGDMVLMRDGTPIVADGAGGGIYRLRDRKVLQRIDAGDFISPQTPALDRDERHLFVPDYLRGIGVLDLATRQVEWIPMANKFFLAGVDGLYLSRTRLLAVQNGSFPERVIAFELDGTGSKVLSQSVIEASTAGFGDPTHGVIAGSDFFYLANSGWDTLDDNGNRKADAKPTRARIMKWATPN